MANTATKLTAVKLFDKRRVVGETMTPVLVNIDTINEALEICDVSAATRSLAIIGMEYAAAAAHVLTIQSDTTDLAVYNNPATTGISFPVGDHLQALAITKAGEALNIKCSVAIGKILVYVVELDA